MGGTWIDSSTMEIRRGGNIPEPCVETPAISPLRRAGAKSASKGKRRVSSARAFAPLIGLWRGVYSQFEERAVRSSQDIGAKKKPRSSNAV
jgi:hypothetical protein